MDVRFNGRLEPSIRVRGLKFKSNNNNFGYIYTFPWEWRSVRSREFESILCSTKKLFPASQPCKMLAVSRLCCLRGSLACQANKATGHALKSALPSRSQVLQPSSEVHTTAVSKMSGTDHVRLWTAERLVSLGQIPAFVGPIVYTTPLTDAIFCTALVLHSHWGIEAIVVDYIRPSLFGGKTFIPNICQGLVWALSAFTLGGLYYFNYIDVGLVNAIKMLWGI